MEANTKLVVTLQVKFSSIALVVILSNLRHTFSLTTHEEYALNDFRELASPHLYRDFMKTDTYLLQWLREYDFDVETALHQFLDTIKWRRENQIDNLIYEDFSIFEEDFPYYMDGFDNDGRPLLWMTPGTNDLRKVALAGKLREYIRYQYSLGEMFQIYLGYLPLNETVNGGIWIMDFGGWTLKNSLCMKCADVMPEIVGPMQRHYPEQHYKVFLINAPRMFSTVFDIMRQVMSQKTVAVMQDYGYDKEQWRQALLEAIPADQVPIQYGGTGSGFKKPHKVRNAVILAIMEKEKAQLHALALANHSTEIEQLEPRITSNSISEPPEPSHNLKAGHHHHYKKLKATDLEHERGCTTNCDKKSVRSSANNAVKSIGVAFRHLDSKLVLFRAIIAINFVLLN